VRGEPTNAQLRGAVLHGLAQGLAALFLEDLRSFSEESYRLLDALEAKESAGEALTDTERLELERSRHAAGMLERDGSLKAWVRERRRKSTQRRIIGHKRGTREGS